MKQSLMSGIAAACLVATPVVAQGIRDSDRRLDASEMTEILAGRVVEFYDGSKSRYGTDGSYRYTYTDDDPPFLGQYTTADDSTVCVTFENGASRCDHFVMDGERLILVIEDGTRFPVRNLTAE